MHLTTVHFVMARPSRHVRPLLLFRGATCWKQWHFKFCDSNLEVLANSYQYSTGIKLSFLKNFYPIRGTDETQLYIVCIHRTVAGAYLRLILSQCGAKQIANPKERMAYREIFQGSILSKFGHIAKFSNNEVAAKKHF